MKDKETKEVVEGLKAIKEEIHQTNIKLEKLENKLDDIYSCFP